MLRRTAIPPVRSVLIYPREDGHARTTLLDAVEYLRAQGVTVVVPSEVDKVEGADGVAAQSLRDVDLIIALGGDGTLLRASRWAARAGIPVLGINLGELGFLTAYHRDEARVALAAAVRGELTWEPRLRMRVEVRLSLIHI